MRTLRGGWRKSKVSRLDLGSPKFGGKAQRHVSKGRARDIGGQQCVQCVENQERKYFKKKGVVSLQRTTETLRKRDESGIK